MALAEHLEIRISDRNPFISHTAIDTAVRCGKVRPSRRFEIQLAGALQIQLKRSGQTRFGMHHRQGGFLHFRFWKICPSPS
jgi:hypothetical protein